MDYADAAQTKQGTITANLYSFLKFSVVQVRQGGQAGLAWAEVVSRSSEAGGTGGTSGWRCTTCIPLPSGGRYSQKPH